MSQTTSHTLVVLRHGQSVWNVEQRFAGSSDVALTDAGIEQARAAGRLLRAQGYAFDLVYTSELQRARRTAGEALAQFAVDGHDVRITSCLNERRFGDLEGMKFTDAASIHGAEWAQPWLWGQHPPGGESMDDVCERLRPWLHEELFPRIRGGTRVLIVSHGNTIRVLDELLRKGEGERLETVPSATPLVYELEGETFAVLSRRYLD